VRPEQPLHFHDPANVVKTLDRMYRIFRGNVSYGNLNHSDEGRNIDGWPVVGVITPGAINTEFAVTHGLGRIPVGFHVVNKNKSVDIYQSTTPWTKTTIYLKASVITATVTLFIF
jgi:hypothetical protein